MATTSDRAAFLHEPHVAVLATVDGHGRPHAMPIWYLYEGGVIIMSVGRGSQKHRNLERNRWATLVVDRRETPYYALMVRGQARIGPALDPDRHLWLAIRYLGEAEGRRYSERTAGHDGISIRLVPDEWIEFHGQAGRRDD
jgi:PPOX class probable F420-dependent enzyme